MKMKTIADYVLMLAMVSYVALFWNVVFGRINHAEDLLQIEAQNESNKEAISKQNTAVGIISFEER